MRLRHWLLLIGGVVALGCLQVAQRTAVVMKGYAVGDGIRRLHARQTDVSWLNVQIAELSSPARLAQVAKDRQLKLVAWSTLSPAPPPAGQPAMRTLAALSRDEAAGGDDTDD